MSGRKTGVDIWLHSFLPSAPHRREWWTSHNSCFTTTEKAPSLHRIGGWVGPGPVQTFWIKKEVSTLAEMKHQAVQHLTQSLHDHKTHFHIHNNSSSNYHQWKMFTKIWQNPWQCHWRSQVTILQQTNNEFKQNKSGFK